MLYLHTLDYITINIYLSHGENIHATMQTCTDITPHLNSRIFGDTEFHTVMCSEWPLKTYVVAAIR